MSTYRYGLKENILGDEWYSIEKKICGFWIEQYTFSSRSNMLRMIDKLEYRGHICFEVD